MTAKEYPEKVAGQASVYRLDSFELTVEFSYSREFKAEYLKCLEIGQGVRVPLYTAPPSVAADEASAYRRGYEAGHADGRHEQSLTTSALIAEIDAIATFARGKDVSDSLYLSQILAVIDKYRS